MARGIKGGLATGIFQSRRRAYGQQEGKRQNVYLVVLRFVYDLDQAPQASDPPHSSRVVRLLYQDRHAAYGLSRGGDFVVCANAPGCCR